MRTKSNVWKPMMAISFAGLGAVLMPMTLRGRENKIAGMPASVSYGKQMLLVGEAEPIAGGKTLMAVWSPDSRTVLVLREYHSHRSDTLNEIPEVSLTLWDAATRRGREIWHKQIAVQAYEGSLTPQWIGKTQIALLHIRGFTLGKENLPQQENFALKMDTVHGSAAEIPMMPLDTFVLSPVGASAYVLRDAGKPGAPNQDDATTTARLQANIVVTSVYRLIGDQISETPLASLENHTFQGWTENGKQMVFVRYERAGDKLVQHWQTLDPATGTTITLPDETKKPPLFQPSAPATSRLSLKSTTARVQEGESVRTVHPVWLESKGKKHITRALLTADGKPVALSPNGTNALYESNGTTVAVALRKVPKAEYLAAVRQTLLSNGKQAALALMMYVQDYDEIFPPSEGDFGDRVNPYLRNRDVLDGFNFSRPGNGLADLEKPAETIMGTIDGPGGKVVVYSDGHAKWQSNADPSGSDSGGDDDDD